MKYLNKEEKKQNPLLIPVIVLSVAVVVLAVLLLWPKDEEQGSSLQQPEQTEQIQQTQQSAEPAESTSAPEETEKPDVGIETPYGTLYYPGIWEDSMRSETKEESGSYQVVFYGCVGEREEWLYTVWFGEAGENAFTVGAVEADGQMIAVSMEMSDFIPDESWSVEEADQICAMQESLNDMIEKIRELPGFEEA